MLNELFPVDVSDIFDVSLIIDNAHLTHHNYQKEYAPERTHLVYSGRTFKMQSANSYFHLFI